MERKGRDRRQSVNIQSFQRVPDITGDDNTDTASLQQMAKSARDYIASFTWCPPIKATYLASGVGAVVAIFLFKFSKKIQQADDQLWVVVGDLPSAYLVVEEDDSPALERYCGLMEDWVAAVRDSGALSEVFPVSTEPTVENAESLERRIAFLLAEIIPRAAR